MARTVPKLCKVLVLGFALLPDTGCVLIGYEQHERDAGIQDDDASGLDGSRAPRVDGRLPYVVLDGSRDAGPSRDARVEDETGTSEPDASGDASALDASNDVEAGTDGALPDAGHDPHEECPESGCSCPPNSSFCASNVWITCNAAGQVVDSVECAGEAPDPCMVGRCVADVGCQYDPAPDGTFCDDGLFCTALDRCESGACVGAQDPCGDTVCITQHCDEASQGCVVDSIHAGAACGPSATCTASGSCASSQSCTGTCQPSCPNQNGSCDLDCSQAQSCDVTCRDDQICNVDCRDTLSCSTTCNRLFSDCNLDCRGAQTCQGTCDGGDCRLDCEDTGSCQNACDGRFAECETNCDRSQQCVTRCDEDASCEVTGCKEGHCEASCRDDSRCEIDCRGAASCTTDCALNSTCIVDCRGATSCELDCSLTSDCRLRCTPGDPNCRLTDCPGGAAQCPDGTKVCGLSCP